MAHYYDNKLKVNDTFLNKIKRIVTTISIFTVAYIASNSVYHIVVGSFCNYFNLHADFNYNGFISIETDYQYWSIKRVTAIFGAGPIICLFIGIYFLYLFNKLIGTVTIVRYYVLWCSILFINFFLVQLISSPFGAFDYKSSLYQGLSVVFAWWRFQGIILAPLAILTAVGLFFFGYFASNDFYKFSFSNKINVAKKGRNLFLLQIYFIPVLLSAPALFLLSDRFAFILHVFNFIGLLIIGFGMVMRNEFNIMPEKATKSDVINRIPLLEGTVAIGLWFLVYSYWS